MIFANVREIEHGNVEWRHRPHNRLEHTRWIDDRRFPTYQKRIISGRDIVESGVRRIEKRGCQRPRSSRRPVR